MKPETVLGASTAPLVWWRIEIINQDGPVAGKGVSVRLAGPCPDVPISLPEPPESSFPQKNTPPEVNRSFGPGAQLLVVLASVREPVLVTVKRVSSMGPCRYSAVIKGVSRASLAAGAVALPVAYEPSLTRVGVVGSAGEGRLVVGSRFRVAAAPELHATVREVHSLPHGRLLVVLSRALPLLPGANVLVDLPQVGGRSGSDGNEGSAVVLGCYSRLDLTRKTAIRELLHRVAESPPRPMNESERYRESGVGAGGGETPPEADAVRVGEWWVSPELLGRCEQVLVQRCRHTGGAQGSELRDALRREGIGPALGESLVRYARSRVIERRGSTWLPAGGSPQEFLALPARRLLARLEAAGADGVDAAAERALLNGGAAVQLADHGLAVLLENGRVFSVPAYRELVSRTVAEIGSAHGELHQRDLSAALGLSRNTTRALVARMARDNLIERASAVHIRTRTGGEQE